MNAPYLIFQLNQSSFAIPAGVVREVVWLPELTPLAEYPAYIAGVFDFRAKTLPVIDLEARFGGAPRPYGSQDKVIVLDWQEIQIGIIVHEVLDVVPIPAAEIEPTPSHGQETRPEMVFFSGVARPGGELVMLVDVDRLIRLPEETVFPPELPVEAGDDEGAGQSLPSGGTEEDKLAALFRARARQLREPLDHRETGSHRPLAVITMDREFFGVDLNLVREFTSRQALVPVPSCPDHILGLLNLRGEIVTVVDLRRLLKMPAPEHDANAAIMIVETDDLRLGIAVDEVEEVITIEAGEIGQPPAATSALQEQHRQFLEGIASYRDRVVSIVDFSSLLSQDELRVHDEA